MRGAYTLPSMTGYARALVERAGVRVVAEARSANHRYLDVRVRVPDLLAPLEIELRRRVVAAFQRGRVELRVQLERLADAPGGLEVDRGLVRDLLEASRLLREAYGLEGDWSAPALLAYPGVLRPPAAEADLPQSLRELVAQAVERALEALRADRRREGAALAADLGARVERCVRALEALEAHAAGLPERLRARLQQRLAALVAEGGVDPARLAQEVALLADRADVTEEIVRLRGHLDEMRRLLEGGAAETPGRQLDFLLQEVLREANTINAKAAELEISRLALAIKAEAEKMREQAQNLE